MKLETHIRRAKLKKLLKITCPRCGKPIAGELGEAPHAYLDNEISLLHCARLCFGAHWRHEHTNYDVELEKIMKKERELPRELRDYHARYYEFNQTRDFRPPANMVVKIPDGALTAHDIFDDLQRRKTPTIRARFVNDMLESALKQAEQNEFIRKLRNQEAKKKKKLKKALAVLSRLALFARKPAFKNL